MIVCLISFEAITGEVCWKSDTIIEVVGSAPRPGPRPVVFALDDPTTRPH